MILKQKLSDEQLGNFFNKLEFFKLGYSWGGYESLAIPFDATKIRTATKWTVSGTAIRLSVGLEDVDDLKNDLAKALARI
ncbi:MAG: hypothetical protein COV36_07720 [Alphaproteobacteria bacterium CG11_big_fil_rev_8_21_14_0_20_44_7]|nr:MAG: hypothetical protein COV36_07720 [Alphaproteobacteria bacterium CG11_big_fil_rev_8_21_14_0_20_44_7]